MAKKTIKKVSKGMATRGTGRMGDKRMEQYDANKRLQDTLASKNFIQNGGEVTSPAQYLNPNRKGTAKQNAFNSNFDRGKSTTNRSPVTMNNSPKKKKK